MTGQSACLYIHGIFPYLLIPYGGPCGSPTSADVQKHLQLVATSIDHALSASNQMHSKSQQSVFKIVLIRAR